MFNSSHEELIPFDTSKAINLSELQSTWADKRMDAWTDLQYNHLSPLQVTLIPLLPYTAILSIFLLLLIPHWQHWFPMIIALTIASIFSIRLYYILWKRGSKLQAEADASIMISVENWVLNRYGLKLDLQKDLSVLLSQQNDEVDINHTGLHLTLPTEEYRLELREGAGYAEPQVIVANVNGEAPTLSK